MMNAQGRQQITQMTEQGEDDPFIKLDEKVSSEVPENNQFTVLRQWLLSRIAKDELVSIRNNVYYEKDEFNRIMEEDLLQDEMDDLSGECNRIYHDIALLLQSQLEDESSSSFVEYLVERIHDEYGERCIEDAIENVLDCLDFLHEEEVESSRLRKRLSDQYGDDGDDDEEWVMPKHLLSRNEELHDASHADEYSSSPLVQCGQGCDVKTMFIFFVMGMLTMWIFFLWRCLSRRQKDEKKSQHHNTTTTTSKKKWKQQRRRNNTMKSETLLPATPPIPTTMFDFSSLSVATLWTTILDCVRRISNNVFHWMRRDKTQPTATLQATQQPSPLLSEPVPGTIQQHCNDDGDEEKQEDDGNSTPVDAAVQTMDAQQRRLIKALPPESPTCVETELVQQLQQQQQQREEEREQEPIMEREAEQESSVVAQQSERKKTELRKQEADHSRLQQQRDVTLSRNANRKKPQTEQTRLENIQEEKLNPVSVKRGSLLCEKDLFEAETVDYVSATPGDEQYHEKELHANNKRRNAQGGPPKKQQQADRHSMEKRDHPFQQQDKVEKIKLLLLTEFCLTSDLPPHFRHVLLQDQQVNDKLDADAKQILLEFFHDSSRSNKNNGESLGWLSDPKIMTFPVLIAPVYNEESLYCNIEKSTVDEMLQAESVDDFLDAMAMQRDNENEWQTS